MAKLASGGRFEKLVLFPEWGGEERVPRSIEISDELRERVRAWNLTWQTVLDPVMTIRWPDVEVGRRWIVEGRSIVLALRDEVGSSIEIVGDFAAYDPDAA